MGHHFGGGSNPAQPRVGYKEIRKRALQDHNPDALIGFEFPAEFIEFLRQNFIKKIYRRGSNDDGCESTNKNQTGKIVIKKLHGGGSLFRGANSGGSMFSSSL